MYLMNTNFVGVIFSSRQVRRYFRLPFSPWVSVLLSYWLLPIFRQPESRRFLLCGGGRTPHSRGIFEIVEKAPTIGRLVHAGQHSRSLISDVPLPRDGILAGWRCPSVWLHTSGRDNERARTSRPTVAALHFLRERLSECMVQAGP
jgi:hypothetical protein